MPDSVIARVADRLDIQPEQTDRVLRTLAQLIKKQSARDGRVRVPGLGVFQRTKDILTFEPDAALAEAVNHRYAGLATVSLTLSPEFEEPDAEMEAIETAAAGLQYHTMDEPEASSGAPEEALLAEEPALGEEPVAAEKPLVDEAPVAGEEPLLEAEPVGEDEPVMDEDALEEREEPFAETDDAPAVSLLDKHHGDGEDIPVEDPVIDESIPDVVEVDATTEDAEADPPEGDEEDVVAEADPDPAEGQHDEDAPEEDAVSEDATLPAAVFATDETAEWAPPGSMWSREDLHAILNEEEKEAEQEDVPAEATVDLSGDLPPQPSRIARETAVDPEKRRPPAWPWLLALITVIVIGGVLYSVFDASDTPPSNDAPTTAAVDTPPVDAPRQAASGADTTATDTPESVAENTPTAEETANDTPTPPDQQGEPSSAAATSSDGPIDRAQGGYTLVVASSTQRDVADAEAARYRRRIDDASIPVDVLQGESNGVLRYRIAVGQVPTTEAAVDLKERLAAQIPESAWVTRILPDS